jgi:hypothetical protein
MNATSRLILGAASAFVLSLALCSAASDTGPQPPASGASDPAFGPNGLFVHTTKPYVMFMGADIAVENDKVFDPVEEVTRGVIVIKVDGNPVNLPLDKDVSIHFRQDLKVTEMGAGVSDLKTDRVYSPGADPFKNFAHAEDIAAGADAAADLAQARTTDLQSAASLPSSPELTPVPAETRGEVVASQATADGLRQEADREETMLSPLAGKEAAAEGSAMFDAIRITFSITPKSDLAKPYLAVIAQIRGHESKPGQIQPWVHLQSLGPLAAGVPTKVTVYQEGMPPGYILEKCEIHIYDGREELATNVSSKRVQLTKNEMLDFRVIEYISDNSGKTLPAAPATFVNDLRSSLSPAQLSQACFVQVAKDGRVKAAFGDKKGTQPLQDPELDAALKGLRFKPAIEAGKPVESIVPVRLGMIVAP